jgi:hypothetical protein
MIYGLNTKFWFYPKHNSYVYNTDHPFDWEGDEAVEITQSQFEVGVEKLRAELVAERERFAVELREYGAAVVERKRALFEKMGLSVDDAEELLRLL